MSANMVDPEHINVLIWAGLPRVGEYTMRFGRENINGTFEQFELREGIETTAGQLLVDANAESVDTLHGDESDARYIYEYTRPIDRLWSPMELLSALNGFEYQACEAESWQHSAARQLCHDLRRRFEDRLPGARTSAWSIRPGDRSAATIAGHRSQPVLRPLN